jgi:non-heme chloroperoxidase
VAVGVAVALLTAALGPKRTHVLQPRVLHPAALQPSALPAGVVDHFFLSDDGVRLHYLEAGAPANHTLIFVPGWTMPAWIWMPQILAFSRAYHVIAFDPRGQGDSAVPPSGYDPARRGRDIANLLSRVAGRPSVVVAWSLGVLDTLAAIRAGGDRLIAGLVLVDNSVGEEPPPPPLPRPHGPPPPHEVAMAQFVRSMFHHVPPEGFLERLTRASLTMPEAASKSLLAYPFPRSYWRETLYSTKVPTLYVIRPRWEAQADTLVRKRPNTEMVLFTNVGHALFVDEPVRFDSVVERFLRGRVWPERDRPGRDLPGGVGPRRVGP